MAAPQPTGLSILVDKKVVNDLLEQKSGAKALARSAANVLLFVLFLALYTSLALGEPLAAHRSFEGYVRRLFDEGAPMKLREVDSASTFWQYTHRSFLPAVYGSNPQKYFYPGATVERLLPMEGGNRLWGVVRVRMLKVQPNRECDVRESLGRFFPPCYGPYFEDAEDHEEFGPPSDTGQAEFSYSSTRDGHRFNGKFATYSPSGYMRALTADYPKSTRDVGLMETESFVSAATRAVFYEFTVYNFNLGLYAVCRVAFEVAPSGRWEKTFDVQVLQQRHLAALGFGSMGEWLLLVGEAVLVLFVLRYIMEEISELWGSTRKLDYFLDAWNLLDWANLVLIIVTLVYRILTWTMASQLQVWTGDPDKQSILTFVDMSPVAMNVRLVHSLTAFNAVLTWFKTVKYISIVPYITTFMQTVTVSQRLLSSFAVVFVMCFYGFVLGYSVAFGQQVATFRTLWQAFVFLMRAFVGDADMSHVYDAAPFLGSVLIVVFVLGMFFILMNLFSAIMIRALADARQQEDAKQARQWEQTLDRARDSWSVLSARLQLELRCRTCVPGLWHRLAHRQKRREELEAKRDLACFARQQAKMPDDLQALGPGNPNYGRRPKKAHATVAVRDQAGDSDDGSEADLGPLFSPEQLRLAGEGSTSDGSLGFGAPGTGAAPEPTPESVGLVVDATRYISSGIVERTRGARGVLFGEIADSRDVLAGVGTVLAVLGRRARDLEAQQEQFLKKF